MNKPRYIVYPGYVMTLNGQRHYVNAADLVRLYGVNPHECIIAGSTDALKGCKPEYLRKLMPLCVRPGGDYTTSR